MERDFDKLIEELKTTPLDRDLTAMEVGVWDRIDAAKKRQWFGQPAKLATNGTVIAAPALSRSAAIAMAVGIGLAVGMLGAPKTNHAEDFSVFSIESPYAPSGLLG